MRTGTTSAEHRALAITAGLLILFATGACAPAGDGGKPGGQGPVTLAARPPVGEPVRRNDTAGLNLPIAAYQIQGQDRLTVSKAERIGVAQCMARHGFADPNARQPTPVADHDPLERRYGITDPGTAAHWGYHLPPGWKGSTEHALPPLRPEEELALTGSTRGRATQGDGCLGEARRRLTPDGGLDDPELVHRIDQSPQSDTDPAVVRAFADWADCMRSKGFDRTRPVKDPKAHKLGAHQTSEEIAEAVADVACKQRTNLVGVWFTTESTYQKGMIQQHAAELAAIKQNNATIVQAATQVVASG